MNTLINKNLNEIEKMSAGSLSDLQFRNIEIKGVSTDTRSIKENQLFIPLVGEFFNGHDFLKKAIENGAVASLWQKDIPRPIENFPYILVDDTLLALQNLAKSYRESLDTTIIGLTGSNGKTSTKDILASILKKKYKTHKTMGNFNNHIGVPLTLLGMDPDTQMAVIELGVEDFGEMEVLSNMARPNIGIITNIGETHIEHFMNKDNIAISKMKFLNDFMANGLFIYNGDDLIMKKHGPSGRGDFLVRSFGSDSNNFYKIEDYSFSEEGVSLKIPSISENHFNIPLIGKHQLYNGAGAIAIASYLGMEADLIQEGLLNIEESGLRNEITKYKGVTILNDAYKSNPNSLDAALETFYFMDGYDRKIAVLGDMLGLGFTEIDQHERIGRELDENQIDYLFLVGFLTRHVYREAIKHFPKDRIFMAEDKFDLVDQLAKLSEDNSLILFKASRYFELEKLIDKLIEKL